MERPTKETAKYYVTHVKDADLNKAMDEASMGMIKWLEIEKKIARLDAYGLASVAMDCRVGAISDTEKNVHCLMPKSLWVADEALNVKARIGPRGQRPFAALQCLMVLRFGSSLPLALGIALSPALRSSACAGRHDHDRPAQPRRGGGRRSRATVTSLVPPSIDAEDYQPKPQDVVRLKDARIVVRVGLDYDLWFDRLLRAGRQAASVLRGGPGYVDASFAIARARRARRERRTRRRPCARQRQSALLARSEECRDHHRQRSSRRWRGSIRPTACYEANRLAFLARLQAKLRNGRQGSAPLQGMPMIAYHNSWAYFARRFRLDFVGFIEPKPGVPPSPAHLAAIDQDHARTRRPDRRAPAARAGKRRGFRRRARRGQGRGAGRLGRRAAASATTIFRCSMPTSALRRRPKPMTDALLLLWPPFLVAVCLVGIHTYFGIQVLTRNVIFVDLALAQIAALGATVAFMLGHPGAERRDLCLFARLHVARGRACSRSRAPGRAAFRRKR